MLSNDAFYWGMTKKYIVAFNHIINDIHVIRQDVDGNTVKDIKCPVTYATKSKLFYYLQRNENIGSKISTFLPRISFVITGLEFDMTRKINNLNETDIQTANGTQTFQYIGVPYNFNISMNIWSVYMHDLLQIIEQMATFFKPDFSMTVNEIPEFNIQKNIPVVLNSIELDIENEFEEEDRVLMANADFTLKGYLYPPVTDSKIIEHMRIKVIDDTLDDNKPMETILIDWDRINDEITTEIITGPGLYEFNSIINNIFSGSSDGEKFNSIHSISNISTTITPLSIKIRGEFDFSLVNILISTNSIGGVIGQFNSSLNISTLTTSTAGENYIP